LSADPIQRRRPSSWEEEGAVYSVRTFLAGVLMSRKEGIAEVCSKAQALCFFLLNHVIKRQDEPHQDHPTCHLMM
jgi:hypothetical protein